MAAFLHETLDLEIESPEAIQFTNTEMSREYGDDKLSRLDVRIKLNNQDHVDIEIQLRDEYDMVNRSIYYLSKLYTDQMKKSIRYKDLGRAISLIILDYNLLQEREYFNRYRFKNTSTNNELTDVVEIDYLELKKVPKEYHSKKDMWATLLSTESEEVLELLAENDKKMSKVVEKLRYVSADDVTRFEYDQRHTAEMDHYARIKRNRDEGLEEGRQQGLEEGLQQGLNKGIRQAKIEIAKSLLDVLDDETISAKTGLLLEEVQEIRKSMD